MSEIKLRIAKTMHPVFFEEHEGELNKRYWASMQRDALDFADKAVREMREIIRDPVRDFLNVVRKSPDADALLDTHEAGMLFKLLEDFKQ